MATNVDLLLEKLRSDSLAHRLVRLLKEAPKESWAKALDMELQYIYEAKLTQVQEESDAEN